MLVISRKTGERINLGEDITVTVLEISGSTVRIGIEAPTDVAVHRHEVWVAVQEENRAAAKANVDDLPSKPST
jgi:carbon storage regulator